MRQDPGLGRQVRQELRQLAGLLRVLAERRRLHILCLLMQRELCVCEILPELGISQPLASHHLGVLSKAGLIRARRDGQRIFYSIVPEALAQVKDRVLAHFDPAYLPPEAAYGQGTGPCPLPDSMPETPGPETPGPETPGPETPGPKTPVPETLVPETLG